MDANATIQAAASSEELAAMTCRPTIGFAVFSDMPLILHQEL
jgi:hypothetical protein